MAKTVEKHDASSDGTSRVLFVESGTEMGGAQTALLTMLQNLDRRRVRPFYASLGFGNGNLPDTVEGLGLPVYRLAAGRFRNLRSSAAKIHGLCRIVREQQIDVVFSNSGHPLLFARPAALWTGRPCVWWVHGYFLHDALRGHAISFAEQLLGADVLFANSESTSRALRVNFPGARIRTVRYGIDLSRFSPAPQLGAAARQSLGIGPSELVVGMFGRLQPWKGQYIFLEAAALLRRRGIRCRFLVVGGSVFGLDLPYAEELQRLSWQLGLQDHVVFLGQREDVNAWMNACDVVVHASIEPEPWGLVVAEAMAAGRAVVAAAAGGPLEMIEDGRTGRLVPPGDSLKLAAALESLLPQPELQARMGVAARQHAELHFETSRAAQVFCAELQQVRDSFAVHR